MLPDYWTVFAAVVLPYVPYLVMGAEKRRRGLYDPDNPRASDAVLEASSRRARFAETNSWEALAAYVAISWIAHSAGADPTILFPIGVAWIGVRVLYITAYVAGKGQLRIAFWTLSALLLLARMGVAVMA
jgi:uncharacterized MAPEG superfamily protein